MNPEDDTGDPSTSERVLRLQDEWDDLAGSPEDLDLTPEQLDELKRRLVDHRLNRRYCKTWAEVRQELGGLGRQDLR